MKSLSLANAWMVVLPVIVVTTCWYSGTRDSSSIPCNFSNHFLYTQQMQLYLVFMNFNSSNCLTMIKSKTPQCRINNHIRCLKIHKVVNHRFINISKLNYLSQLFVTWHFIFNISDLNLHQVKPSVVGTYPSR